MSAVPLVKVNVRNLAVGGAGVGEVCEQADGGDNLLGITAFVPFSVAGELVEAQVVQHKKRYLTAELVRIERPSAERVEPRCEYYTVCGGCELQHMSYESQLDAKREMISGALRASRLSSAVVDKVLAVKRSIPYGYRRRVSLHIDSSGRVGFYRAQSRAVVPITNCPVAEASINEHLVSIQEFGKSVQGKVSSLLLEADDNGVVAVLKSPYELNRAEIQTVLTEAKKYFSNATLLVGNEEVGGFGRQILELPLNEGGSFAIQVPAGSFSQVNWRTNQALIEDVVKQIKSSNSKPVVEDLFAGAGNFAFPIAREGAAVTAVECDKRLVAFGKQNAERLKLSKQVTFIESSVESYLQRRPAKKEVDIIIADPPRSGLGTIAAQIAYAKRILLISCHLPSFARDVKALTEIGYNVNSIESYDMFAQTSYVEILAVLDR